MVTTNDSDDSGDIETVYDKKTSYNITNTKDDKYINPKADFKCWHEINANGIITGLVFAQDGTADFSVKTNPYDNNDTIPTIP